MQPKVSIIVTSYHPGSRHFLDLCMRSIFNLIYDNFEVIIVGRGDYLPSYREGDDDGYLYPGDRNAVVKTVAPPHDEPFGCAEGLNYGISWSDPASQYILTCNDDVIFTRDSLKHLVEAAGENDVIINPTSNCDNLGMYSLALGYTQANGDQVRVQDRQYGFESLEPHASLLMNAVSVYPQGLIVYPCLYFYATLIPRKVWEKVGTFDEQFKTGQDDVDYSWRARRMGVTCAVALNAIVWHFSGASASSTLTTEIREENMRRFIAKWGRKPYDDLQELALDEKVLNTRELDFIGE